LPQWQPWFLEQERKKNSGKLSWGGIYDKGRGKGTNRVLKKKDFTTGKDGELVIATQGGEKLPYPQRKPTQKMRVTGKVSQERKNMCSEKKWCFCSRLKKGKERINCHENHTILGASIGPGPENLKAVKRVEPRQSAHLVQGTQEKEESLGWEKAGKRVKTVSQVPVRGGLKGDGGKKLSTGGSVGKEAVTEDNDKKKGVGGRRKKGGEDEKKDRTSPFTTTQIGDQPHKVGPAGVYSNNWVCFHAWKRGNGHGGKTTYSESTYKRRWVYPYYPTPTNTKRRKKKKKARGKGSWKMTRQS